MSSLPIVAFQGELGAFSEEAVQTWFGPDVEPLPCREFRQVGEAVRDGTAAAGLLPLENTLAGTVQPAYDVLLDPELIVVGEVIRPIRHFLLGLPGASLDALRRVISHPVALAQCGNFLSRHPSIEAVAVYDTAGAAIEVAAGKDPSVGAIASKRAADRYGLAVLAPDLQDRSDNQTRFVVVRQRSGKALPQEQSDRGRTGAEGSGTSSAWKTALLVETENRPGALVDILLPLSREGVNLTKLESRPGLTPWSYRFFLEFEGGPEEPRTARALEAVEEHAHSVRVLGTFRPWREGSGGG